MKRLTLWFANSEAGYRACYLFKRNMGCLIFKENSQFFSSIRKPEQSPASANLRAVNRRERRAALDCGQPRSTFTAREMCPAGSHSWSILYTTDICNSHTFALIYYLLTDADKCSWKPKRTVAAGECLMVEMSKIIWLNIHTFTSSALKSLQILTINL